MIKKSSNLSLIIPCFNEQDNLPLLFKRLLKIQTKFSEIILVGSGKGVISVTNVQGMIWRRKSLKHYKILKKYYEKAVTKCPRYYS